MRRKSINLYFPTDKVLVLSLFGGLFLLNACLVSPFIGWYDSGELIGSTVCLGISHPSGQVPLHLLGKCFMLWPFGTPAFKMGLMSAACAAGASVLFFLLSCNLVSRLAPPNVLRKDLPSTLKVWLLFLTLGWSLSLPWWRYSLTPLVYALHLLLGMLLLWALSLEKKRKWMLCGFILGVGTILRPTQFFALPFVGAAFLWEYRKDLRGALKQIIFLLLCCLLGRSVALYLPLRSALHPEMAFADLTRFKPFFHHVMALKFSKYVGTVSSATVLSVAKQMAGHFFRDLTVLGAGLVLWGSVVLWWKREKLPPFLWVALGWGLLEALFVFTIPFPTFESHQVILGWAYCGLLAVLPLIFIEQVLRKGQYRALMTVGTGVMAFFVAAQASMIGHLIDRKHDRGADDYAKNALTIMETKALYFPAEENEYFPLAGYQQSFGFRKDIELIEPGTSDVAATAMVQKCLAQGHPLYVTRHWALPPGWVYEAHGPIWKVVRASPLQGTKPLVLLRPDAKWGKLSLLRVGLNPERVRAGGILHLDYRWMRAGIGPQDDSVGIVALFADDQGNYWKKNGLFWFHDIHDVPYGSFTHLKPGLLYEEKRVLFVPSDLPPGRYHLAIALQKRVARREGKESFDKEFYERNIFQNLDKFQGRGEQGAVVQFAADLNSKSEDFWPVTEGHSPAGSRFATVAEVIVEAQDNR